MPKNPAYFSKAIRSRQPELGRTPYVRITRCLDQLCDLVEYCKPCGLSIDENYINALIDTLSHCSINLSDTVATFLALQKAYGFINQCCERLDKR